MDSRLNVALNISIDDSGNGVSELSQIFVNSPQAEASSWPARGGGRQTSAELTTTHSIHIPPQRHNLGGLRR